MSLPRTRRLRAADLTVWAAVEAHQKALIDEEVRGAPMSVFTGRLLSGVRDAEADADSDGVVTRSELHAYLIRESEAYCDRHRHRCARGLTPQLHGASGSMDAPAFVRVAVSLPPQARVAKDILIGPASSAAADRFEGGVKLRIAQGTRLEVGTEVGVEVTSPRDGYLVLLDIDAAGDMVQIFPNEISLRNGAPERVRAGDPMRLPSVRDSFRLRVSPPAGRGTLVAIVSDETPQLGALTARHKDLSVVERPKAYLVEMAEVLRGRRRQPATHGRDAGVRDRDAGAVDAPRRGPAPAGVFPAGRAAGPMLRGCTFAPGCATFVLRWSRASSRCGLVAHRIRPSAAGPISLRGTRRRTGDRRRHCARTTRSSRAQRHREPPGQFGST